MVKSRLSLDIGVCTPRADMFVIKEHGISFVYSDVLSESRLERKPFFSKKKQANRQKKMTGRRQIVGRMENRWTR